jgi:O-antigen/teichoic acid export membrane protein
MDSDRSNEAEEAQRPGEGARMVDPATATTGASVARGSAWFFAVNAVPQLYLVAISIVAAHVLGPDLFGRQSFIAFVEISLVMLLTEGFVLALARFVASSLGERRAGAVAGLTRLSWQIAIPSAAVAGVTLSAIALAGAEPTGAWLLAGVVAVATVLMRGPQAVLTGFQLWRPLAILGLVTGTASTVAIVAVLEAGGGITGMFAVEAAAAVAAFIWIMVLARRTVRPVVRRSAEEKPPLRDVVRYTGVVTVGTLLTLIVWRRSEFLFLDAYSSDAEIGLYSVAFAAVTALTYAPSAVASTLLPAVATLHGAGAIDRIRTGFGRAERLVLAMALPLAAAAAALGPELISLVYGERFADAGTLVLILLAPFPLFALMGLSTAVVEAMGHLRVPFLSALVAAGMNIVLSFVLVPAHDAVGAALASAISQVAAALPPIVYAHRFVGHVSWRAGFLVRLAAATGVGGGAAVLCVVALGGFPGVIAGLIAGVGGFSAIAATTRILCADDAEWLDSTIGGAAGGRVGRLVRLIAQPRARPEAEAP